MTTRAWKIGTRTYRVDPSWRNQAVETVLQDDDGKKIKLRRVLGVPRRTAWPDPEITDDYEFELPGLDSHDVVDENGKVNLHLLSQADGLLLELLRQSDPISGPELLIEVNKVGEPLRVFVSLARRLPVDPAYARSEVLAARLLRHRQLSRRREALRQRTASLLDLWGAMLPQRIVHEDLGDYLEDIHRRISAGQRWRVYLRVIAAIFWTGLNAVGYAMKVLGKRKAS